MTQKSDASRRIAGRRKARHYALQALYQWQMAGASIGDIEAQFHADNDLSNTDTAYFGELLHGIPGSLDTIDALFTPLLDRNLDDLDPVELNLLRMGCYELMNSIDVPYRVVINETVNLAKRFGATDGHRYINAVLDKVARQLRKPELNAGL